MHAGHIHREAKTVALAGDEHDMRRFLKLTEQIRGGQGNHTRSDRIAAGVQDRAAQHIGVGEGQSHRHPRTRPKIRQ